MGIINNYLDETEKTFLEASIFAAGIDDLWTSNGTIAIDPTDYLDSSYGSLKLTPSASENYVRYNFHASTANIPSQFAITNTNDVNDFVETFMWVKPTKNCTLHLSTILSKVSLNAATTVFNFVNPFEIQTGVESTTVVALGGSDLPKWQLIRAVPIQIPSSGRWSIQIKLRVVFDSFQGAFLNIARPTAHPSRRIFFNSFLADTLSQVPSVFLEADTANFTTNDLTYPLARFMDVATMASDQLLEQVSDFEYLDKSEGGSSENLFVLSKLINPEVADTRYLPWLAQFRGRPLLVTYQPSTNGIGWQIFALDISYLSSGDGTGANPALQNDVLGSDGLNAGSLPEGIDAYTRWQIQTASYGHNAGTINSMVGAIKRGLTGTQTVNFSYLSANQIKFETSYTETYGAVVGDIGSSASTLLSLLEPARPLGMLVTHELTA